MQEIYDQPAKLRKIETDWKLNEVKMQAEIKQKETEMSLRLDEEKTKLQMLQADKEVKVAAARVKAYNDFEDNPEDYNRGENETEFGAEECNNRFQLNPKAEPFQYQQISPEVKTSQETVSLAQTLVNSLSLSRLPVPEPIIFTGDPLKFVNWKM